MYALADPGTTLLTGYRAGLRDMELGGSPATPCPLHRSIKNKLSKAVFPSSSSSASPHTPVCHLQILNSISIPANPHPCAGESRTAAYVAANGGADTVFDSFSFETSAQEILLNLMRTYLPVRGRENEGDVDIPA